MNNTLKTLLTAAMACAVAFSISGCAPLNEGTLIPQNDLRTQQDYQNLAAIIKAYRGNGKDSKNLTGDDITAVLGKTKTETAVIVNGEALRNPDGTVIMAKSTSIQRGLPIAPSRTKFKGGEAFMSSKLATSISNNPDGALLEFNQATEIDTEAYQSGIEGQAARTATAWNVVGALGNSALGVAKELGAGWLILTENNEKREFTLEAQEQQFAQVRWLEELKASSLGVDEGGHGVEGEPAEGGASNTEEEGGDANTAPVE